MAPQPIKPTRSIESEYRLPTIFNVLLLLLVPSRYGTGGHGRLRTGSGDVRVKVPALKRYGRMAEIAAVHAATHQGFPSEEVDELSQAIREAVQLLLDPGAPNGSVSFDYQSKAGNHNH